MKAEEESLRSHLLASSGQRGAGGGRIPDRVAQEAPRRKGGRRSGVGNGGGEGGNDGDIHITSVRKYLRTPQNCLTWGAGAGYAVDSTQG